MTAIAVGVAGLSYTQQFLYIGCIVRRRVMVGWSVKSRAEKKLKK